MKMKSRAFIYSCIAFEFSPQQLGIESYQGIANMIPPGLLLYCSWSQWGMVSLEASKS
jgi:hypothetical protein